MHTDDLQDLKKILDLYNDTSKTMDDIRTKINKNSMSEQDELSLHYNSFKNMKNFLATQINKSIISFGYNGLKEDDMLLPSEVSSRDEKYNFWQKHAFGDATNNSITVENSGIDIGVFENVLNWSKIASINEDLEELSKLDSRATISGVDKELMKEILIDTAKRNKKIFHTYSNEELLDKLQSLSFDEYKKFLNEGTDIDKCYDPVRIAFKGSEDIGFFKYEGKTPEETIKDIESEYSCSIIKTRKNDSGRLLAVLAEGTPVSGSNIIKDLLWFWNEKEDMVDTAGAIEDHEEGESTNEAQQTQETVSEPQEA